jgi:hypothetical protein
MLTVVRLLLLGLFFLLCTPVDSEAVVGIIDANDEFPFVVRLETQYADGSLSWCSGVAHGHVLSTAAHCLYNSDPGMGHGLAVKISVPYVDTLGRHRTAFSKKLFVPRSYIDVDEQHHQDYGGAIHDIGYVVLDHEVLVNGYIHWGLELLENVPAGNYDCEEPECMDWSLNEERKESFIQNIQREVGDLNSAKVRIIGYGNYRCADYDNREKDCVSDGNRRYTELQLKPDVASPSAPWLWCTGKGNTETNPVQHGDSGGPVFVQAIDGRWLYVGYTSRGNSQDGCASSMFNDLNLWRNAISAYQRGKVIGPNGDLGSLAVNDEELASWHQGISRQFFLEWLQNESAPEQIALDRLMDFYMRAFSPTLAPRFREGNLSEPWFDYHGRKLSFNDIYSDKKQYFERWPRRTLSPSSVSVDCGDQKFQGVDKCTVSSVVDWTVQNSERQLRGQSQITLTLNMPFYGSSRLLFFDFSPTVLRENGAVLSKGNERSSNATSVKQIKQNISNGYINLRAGPGQDQPILAQIPAGERVVFASECVQPNDGVSKSPFCWVVWNGRKGWVSASGLE